MQPQPIEFKPQLERRERMHALPNKVYLPLLRGKWRTCINQKVRVQMPGLLLPVVCRLDGIHATQHPAVVLLYELSCTYAE